jgi:hypothetical protein
MNQITVPFFTLPQNLVRTGILREMKPCEIYLAVALHHEMERLSNPVLTVTNAQLHNLTGLSPSAIRLARTKLAERGVTSLRRVAGGMYEYSLLNPATGKPWPRRRRGRGPGGSGPPEADPPESGQEIYQPALSEPKREPAGVPLDF